MNFIFFLISKKKNSDKFNRNISINLSEIMIAFNSKKIIFYMKRKRLTPDQKAKIIEYYGRYNNKWTFIAFRINLPESTVCSFIKEY